MEKFSATAVASPNIAFIKYWGNKDDALRIPANSSLSMNLDGLFTETSVHFDQQLCTDELNINNQKIIGKPLERVSQFLDTIRSLAKKDLFASINSKSNFPQGVGIASSASAFAALALAGSRAIGLKLNIKDLSRLARRGSGSACRSIPSGFVEWNAGESDHDSFAFSVAEFKHWNITDLIAVIDETHKEIGSSQGHQIASSSPLQRCRISDVNRRLKICKKAINDKDFEKFANVVELDSNLLHAVMMTSTPALFYWQAGTLEIMQEVREWRKEGLAVCYTIDAGPNVHIICEKKDAETISERLKNIPSVKYTFQTKPGDGARLVQQ